ncbi:MAG: NERD domain-containing protein [Lachnospiraceae bacterium]|nr:NERD domain-containing protein [Lachnospiraceae bacterium]
MGLFSKPEVVILKESNEAKDYLQKLQDLLPKANGDVKEKIEKEIAIVNAGIYGEDNILFELKNSGMNLVVLHDLYIKTKSGLSAQIDFFVVAPKCFYVIECKNLFGNIEINNNGDFIRTINLGKRFYKEGIYSPITQNERHLNVLKEIRTENSNAFMRMFKNVTFEDFFKGVVVLANSKTVVNDKYAKKEVKNKVIRADQLIRFIKETEQNSKELSSSLKEMIACAQSYLDSNVEERPEYIEKYKELVNEVGTTEEPQIEKVIEPDPNAASSENELICPRCGSTLVLRTAKKGDNAGNQFYGCSAFPKCRYIKNI